MITMLPLTVILATWSWGGTVSFQPMPSRERARNLRSELHGSEHAVGAVGGDPPVEVALVVHAQGRRWS